MMDHAVKKQAKKKTAKVMGIPKRTNIKVGSSLGDFWTKLKGLYPG